MKKLLAVVILSSLLLTACFSNKPKDEKQAYIDATIEATCVIFQSDNIFDPALEDDARKIYKKHGFDADDEVVMQALTDKYGEMDEVQKEIAGGLESCAGDALKNLESTFGDISGGKLKDIESTDADEEEAVDSEAVEEKVVDSEAVEEETVEEEVVEVQ